MGQKMSSVKVPYRRFVKMSECNGELLGFIDAPEGFPNALNKLKLYVHYDDLFFVYYDKHAPTPEELDQMGKPLSDGVMISTLVDRPGTSDFNYERRAAMFITAPDDGILTGFSITDAICDFYRDQIKFKYGDLSHLYRDGGPIYKLDWINV